MKPSLSLIALAAAAVLSCGPNPLFPATLPNELVDGPVRVTLDVSPASVDPPGTVRVTLRYENMGIVPVDVVSGYGCLSFASVYRGETRIPFPATQYACTAAIARHPLLPGQPLTMEWTLRIGGAEGMQVPPGAYRFVAKLNTHPENLERTFVVR